LRRVRNWSAILLAAARAVVEVSVIGFCIPFAGYKWLIDHGLAGSADFLVWNIRRQSNLRSLPITVRFNPVRTRIVVTCSVCPLVDSRL
jgi:hypothetical protein